MTALDDVNSIEEAAAYLRVQPAALVRLARTHKIAFLKSGRALTFTREALEAYRTVHEVPAVAANPFGLTDASTRRMRAAKGKTA